MRKNEVKSNKKELLFVGLLFLTISLSFALLIFLRFDPDYFWHIKAGEYMFKNGILKQDVFSWYLNSKYWMSHEWLFEIIIYAFKLVFGKFHVIVYCFLSLLLLSLVMFVANKKNCLKNIPFTFFWYLIFFVMIIFYVNPRPHLFSFSLLAFTVWTTYDLYRNEDSRKIYFLPLITILWANFHGGSSNLPYLFCLAFMIGGLFSFNKSKIESHRLTKKQFLKYFVVMVLCMICVCINVHGFKMFIYPYENMANKTMLSNISEWRNTSLSEGIHYIYFVVLLIVIFIMLFSKKKIEFMDLLLLGVATYLGLKSIRFWIYLYIIMSFVIFNYIDERKVDRGAFSCMIIFSIILLGFFLANIDEIINIKYKDRLNKEVVDVLKKEQPKRLFNMYNFGGELVYHDIKVFVDGRADLYSNYNYKDYLNISLLKKDYVKLIDKYNFDYFLVDKDSSINTYLKYSNDYELLYKDDESLIYKKT